MTSDQFKRLPQYARFEIERLRANELALVSELRQTGVGPIDLNRYARDDEKRERRSDRTTGRCWFDEWARGYVDFHFDQGRDELTVRGSTEVAITPNAANSFVVEVKP